MDCSVLQHHHNRLRYNDEEDFVVYNDLCMCHFHCCELVHQLVDILDRWLEHVKVLRQHYVHQL